MKFNNNKRSSERATPLSFTDWTTKNNHSVTTHLIDLGTSFINNQAEDLKSPIVRLLLDNRWHYLDKARKQSYRGSLETTLQDLPILRLTYFTFRHGQFSVKFDSKQAIKEMWIQAKGIGGYTPTRPAIIKPTHPIIMAPATDWIARDEAHWATLPSTGVSHYLNRKGFKDTVIPGIRYARDHIALAITNCEQAFLGLQRVFNDGQKRFTKGLAKKGHFAVIGQDILPVKPTTLHVCEGVATAASIHLATGEPVFCALDAFNLLPVSRHLKRHYKKTPILIWADNDWQKAEKPTKFGHVVGNTGLIQANRTAFKLRNAMVCTPDFSGFEVNLIEHATDFNDLHQLAGLDALQTTLPCKPDLHLGLWHELQRYTHHAHGALSPQQFNEGLKHTYHSRYLPTDVFDREGVHLVRSAIGTGKTAIVENLVKQNPNQSVLFTTHLISLVESAAQRLGLVSYNECDTVDLQIETRLAICLNSLGKLTAEGALKPYDIVVIDEIEQVLARLTSHIEQKPLVFSVLQHLMANAKTLICLDAHLSQATVQMVQRFCPDIPVTVHFNQIEPGKERQIAFHESPESVQMAALQALEQDKNVYLAFNSKKEAFKTYSVLKATFPDKKGLYICSDNAGDKDNQAFFNDVNKVSKRYDYLLCTPSVSTGVSLDNSHFDFVGGIFNANINTANDCMQALGRVRNHPTLHVFCDKRQGNHSLNPDVIAAKWFQTHPFDVSLMNLGHQGQRILLNPDYEQLMLLVTQARHVSFNDFYQQFALLALHDGMTLTYYDNPIDDTTQQQLRHFKKACIEEDTLLINTDLLPMTAAQLVALAKKPRKTMAESLLVKKNKLMAFYNLSAHDTQSIDAMVSFDSDGRFKQQVLALELAVGDAEIARKRFLSQLEEGAQFAADLEHFATRQQIYQQLLQALRLNTTEPRLNVQAFHYTRETLLDSGFIDWVEEHRPILQGLFTIPPKERLRTDPLRFVSMLLAQMGLKQKRVGKSLLGVYQINPERLQLMNALLLRRQQGFSGVQVPLDTSSVSLKKERPVGFLSEFLIHIKRFLEVPELVIPQVS